MKCKIFRKVEGVVWNARKGNARTDLNYGAEECFLYKGFV